MTLTPGPNAPDVSARSPIPALGTVLCAVDASESAADVLYAASGFAANPQSRLVVLRVDGRANGSSDDVTKAEVELQALARSSIPGWISYREGTEFLLRAGDTAETILALAVERGANLIVIGTHARGVIRRALFGSVVERVMRGATVPVAIVPPSEIEVISLTDSGAVSHLGSVLVPVSLDESATRQLAFASKLSLASNREALLLHVVPPNSDGHAPLKRLEEMVASVHSPHGVRAVVTHGSVLGAILSRQAQANAGVIVLGRDPHSPGKVARELLQQTGAVVVFVP